jgi:hypothetical protein
MFFIVNRFFIAINLFLFLSLSITKAQKAFTIDNHGKALPTTLINKNVEVLSAGSSSGKTYYALKTDAGYEIYDSEGKLTDKSSGGFTNYGEGRYVFKTGGYQVLSLFSGKLQKSYEKCELIDGLPVLFNKDNKAFKVLTNGSIASNPDEFILVAHYNDREFKKFKTFKTASGLFYTFRKGKFGVKDATGFPVVQPIIAGEIVGINSDFELCALNSLDPKDGYSFFSKDGKKLGKTKLESANWICDNVVEGMIKGKKYLFKCNGEKLIEDEIKNFDVFAKENFAIVCTKEDKVYKLGLDGKNIEVQNGFKYYKKMSIPVVIDGEGKKKILTTKRNNIKDGYDNVIEKKNLIVCLLNNKYDIFDKDLNIIVQDAEFYNSESWESLNDAVVIGKLKNNSIGLYFKGKLVYEVEKGEANYTYKLFKDGVIFNPNDKALETIIYNAKTNLIEKLPKDYTSAHAIINGVIAGNQIDKSGKEIYSLYNLEKKVKVTKNYNHPFKTEADEVFVVENSEGTFDLYNRRGMPILNGTSGKIVIKGDWFSKYLYVE